MPRTVGGLWCLRGASLESVGTSPQPSPTTPRLRPEDRASQNRSHRESDSPGNPYEHQEDISVSVGANPEENVPSLPPQGP
ncbi:hypothetical protein OE88DRAFT_1662022 [Heliocybe sulcata]|uniref:Uncharacterized protein n=1 Tax=Heliocybe sulcata TaxID=5364 RepID=A0A5C3MXB7_9AGAM|nr:hypothetical protein OE88DRAFT_1662022 [Heliocybe sulcata]